MTSKSGTAKPVLSSKPKSKPTSAGKPAGRVARLAARPVPATNARKPEAVSAKPAAKNGSAAAAAKAPAKKPPARPTPVAASNGKTAAVAKAKPAAVIARPAVKLPETKVAAKSAVPVAVPVKTAMPLASVKPGVKNGEPAVARIAVKPQLVAGLTGLRTASTIKPLAKSLKLKSSRPKLEPIPVRLPPAPVRSDSKMARNQAGISSRELEHFRDLLFEKRREITGDVSSMETTALRTGSGSLSTLPMHMADAGTDNYEQEFTLGLVEKDRKLLNEINVALAKILDGSYGICEGTGKPIAKPRLEAQPWAKYSIEHARQLERPQYRRAF